jgi:hypothetical protein
MESIAQNTDRTIEDYCNGPQRVARVLHADATSIRDTYGESLVVLQCCTCCTRCAQGGSVA